MFKLYTECSNYGIVAVKTLFICPKKSKWQESIWNYQDTLENAKIDIVLTGQSFKTATILNAGAFITSLKGHGGCKFTTVAEDYLDTFINT